jgi:hypothetical protein
LNTAAAWPDADKPMAKLKHQRRSQPRRPTERRRSRVKQQRTEMGAQLKLDRWRAKSA